MEFTTDKFNTVKRDADTFYSAIGKIRCPYFGEDVHFDVKGWDHLIFHEWNKTRLLNDQFARLRHIQLAPEVIRQSKTLQGVWRTQQFERTRMKNRKWAKTLKRVSFYEFIAVMDSHGSKVRVKVIVKQIDGGEKHFLSIIPYWGVNRATGERIMHSGNPKVD